MIRAHVFVLIAVLQTAAAGKKCASNEFACANGKKCVPNYRFCDGSNDCGDNSDEIRRNKSIGQSGIPCRDDSGRVCMLPEPKSTGSMCWGDPDCDSDEFACVDGSACLKFFEFCDGYTTCRDGSDEVKRNYSSPDPLIGLPCRAVSNICMLPEDQVSKKALLCPKNPDCEDNEFMCAGGTQCISLDLFCNGHIDCSDGSDEVKANLNASGIPCRPYNNICMLPDNQVPQKGYICKKRIDCDDNEFLCQDGTKCIPAGEFCDGGKDCGDGSDEILRDLTLAPTQSGFACRRYKRVCMFPEDGDITKRKNICKNDVNCGEDEFLCMDGSECIEQKKFCDKQKDCKDGSDEILFNVNSPITGTRCPRKNLICVLPLSQSDKTDVFCLKKSECADNEFACLDGSACLPTGKFCDNKAHCADGSDEIKAFHPDSNVTGIICRRTRYTCLLHDNETTKEDAICNYADPKCGPNEFACVDGLQCVPKEKFCDNLIDCRDGSDEIKRNRRTDIDFEAVPCRRDTGVCWLPKEQQNKKTKLCKRSPRCKKSEFQCSDGTACLATEAFCNGSAECIDGSDEMKEGSDNSAAVGGSRCRQDSYKCILPVSQINKRSTFCKKKFQCQDKEFACLDGAKCILSWWFCDGYADCDDGSDEIPVGSAIGGVACRRDIHTCLLPPNMESEKKKLCKITV